MIPILTAVTLVAHLALLAEAGPVFRRGGTSSAAAASTTTRASQDLQTYNSGLGAIYAPAVTQSGKYWYSNGQQYNFLTEALSGSCYVQMDKCQLKANQQGNTPFAVSDCNGWQIQACLNGGNGSPASSSATASSAASTSSSSASAAKSSSASASSSSSSTASSSSSASSSTSSAASAPASSASSAAKSSSASSTSSAAPSVSATSAAASSTSSKASSASSASSSASPTTAPTAVAEGNFQTFTGAAGGIVAPAVTRSGSQWVQSGTTYDGIYWALQQSCYAQASSCSSSSLSFDKSTCWGTQVNNCLNNAQTVSDAYSASAAVYSSSVASANFAAATQARTVSGDLQSFTGALAGIPAPAVTGSQYNWKVEGKSDNYYNLIDALSSSCYIQQDKAGAAGAAANWAYELNGNNIYNVQINNCLNNARNVASNWSPTSTAAATSAVNTAALASASAASAAAASASSAAAAAAAAAASVSSAAAAAASSASAAAASVSSAAASASSAAAASASSAAAALLPPAGWSAALTPCVAEGPRGRALTGPTLASADMTWQKCADFCDGQGYPIFGIEYSQECYCGATLSNGASLNTPSTNCNMKCGGSGAICGGGSALTVFVRTSALSGSLSSDLTSVKITLPDGWVNAPSTCVQEGSTGRALAGASYADDSMTVGKCLAFCTKQGMQWAGIEYGRECYCGNDLVNGASLDRIGTCDMSCGGQLGVACGGPNLLTLFKDVSLLYTLSQVGDFAKQGCIQEVAGRALTGASLVKDNMTLEICTSFCSQKGFGFAGLEYGTECYCGNTLDNGATLGAFSTECKMSCGGKPGQTCGGPNAISLYSTHANALVGA